METINFFKNNIEWLKDFFTLILAVVASVITILTYLKAKKTILQPLRTEVIKKQIEILSELLDSISNQEKLFMSCDYFNIFDLNLKIYLLEIGFTNNALEETQDYLKGINSGSILCVDEDEEIHAFSKLGNDPKQTYKEYQEFRYNEAKNGTFKIQLVHYTKQYADFSTKLNDICNSPFIQNSIKIDLQILLKKNHINLSSFMKAKIEDSINNFVKTNIGTINTHEHYNEFSNVHEPLYEHAIPIIKKRRNELKIDEKWW
jgi:hypothetical protein